MRSPDPCSCRRLIALADDTPAAPPAASPAASVFPRYASVRPRTTTIVAASRPSNSRCALRPPGLMRTATRDRGATTRISGLIHGLAIEIERVRHSREVSLAEL